MNGQLRGQEENVDGGYPYGFLLEDVPELEREPEPEEGDSE